MTMIEEAARELIERYRLHDNGAPVDLAPLEDDYPIVRANLAGTGLRGFVHVESDEITVVLDSSLSAAQARLTYMHEVAHVELGHEGSLRCDAVNPWFDARQEREARRFTAIVLIPTPRDIIDWSVPAIIENCQVTPDLVEIWRSAW